VLAAFGARRTRDLVVLGNGVTIKIQTASYQRVRGYTVVAAICDEIAFWRDETSANPDIEIIRALRPAMATVPGAILLVISSPYARRGVLWKMYNTRYGNDDVRAIVWRAATTQMNPSISCAFIEEAYKDDPIAAAAEYGAEFRNDVDALIDPDVVENVVVHGRRELLPQSNLRYVAFVDPSGGSGGDAMTLAIAHRDGQCRVLDLIRERRSPFNPSQVVDEFAAELRRYRITSITGDRYAGEWPREQFRTRGIEYKLADRTKSELYQALVPMVNSGMVELLDHPRLVTQLCMLERRTRAGGRDTIDHPPHAHDDLINAAAGALAIPEREPLQIYAA
jgi:hypothetical protein